ncbi:MAG: hypothetical protein NW217_11195 [Hyphomicrobiaceae bacterium]|nr:hypothetical protein [Hyphomicrobiaceae bacterium]
MLQRYQSGAIRACRARAGTLTIRVTGRLARIVSITLAMALLILSAAPASAALQQAPNSRVVLDLPADYKPAPLFSGFQNEQQGTSIVVLEAPAQAYEEIARGFNAEALATRGITATASGQLARPDRHVYMRARQSSSTGDYAKFFVLFATSDQTVMVTVNVPDDALRMGTVKVADIEAVLSSARTVATTAVRELYRLGYLGPFKEAGTLVGTSKVYTLDGNLQSDAGQVPRATFLVAPSLDKRPILEPERTATRLLSTLSGYEALQLGSPTRLTVDGLEGIRIEGTARLAGTGHPVHLMQVLLVGRGGGYFRLLGFAPPQSAGDLMPELRKIAESFTLSNAPAPVEQPAR